MFDLTLVRDRVRRALIPAPPPPEPARLIAREIVPYAPASLPAPLPTAIEREAAGTGIVTFAARVTGLKQGSQGGMWAVTFDAPQVSVLTQSVGGDVVTANLPFSLARHLVPMVEYDVIFRPRSATGDPYAR